MSLSSLTSVHTITVYAVADGDDKRDDAGAIDKSDRWAADGTVYKCRIQPLSSGEIAESLQAGYEISHRLYFSTEPSIRNGAKIVFGSREFVVMGTVVNTDELNRLWSLNALETEQR